MDTVRRVLSRELRNMGLLEAAATFPLLLRNHFRNTFSRGKIVLADGESHVGR